MLKTIVYECLKALSDVREHQISLRKSSKDNNIDWVSYVVQKAKKKVVILWENIRWLLWTSALIDI